MSETININHIDSVSKALSAIVAWEKGKLQCEDGENFSLILSYEHSKPLELIILPAAFFKGQESLPINCKRVVYSPKLLNKATVMKQAKAALFEQVEQHLSLVRSNLEITQNAFNRLKKKGRIKRSEYTEEQRFNDE